MLVAAVLVIHLVSCALLGAFGLHRVWLLVEWLSARGKEPGVEELPLDAALPHVTVQLPLYNEREVVDRLIDAVCALAWPRDRLEVQVLDDSDDDTEQRVAERVQLWRRRGVDVVQLRRPTREGFKAGALAHGTACAKGDLIAIFDADFVPRPDFLARVVPSFGDAGVDMVQARWGHLNRDESWLTRAQALFLDAHFTIEHGTRAARGRFFNFNGTAGVWRKSAIERAGGWDAATLTEDLDLSFRAQLAGSRFRYLDDVEVPAELPACVNAFKGQQHRWAKGSLQTARRLLGRVWCSPLPFLTKLDATLKLSQNVAFLLLALVVITMPVVALLRAHGATPLERAGDVFTLGAATLPVAVHFFAAQLARGASVWRSLARVPLAIGLGAALSVNNARAALEGIADVGSQEFVRTPKRGAESALSYKTPLHPTMLLELALGALHLAAATLLVVNGHAWTTPFLWLFGASLTLLGLGSAQGALASRRRRRAPHLTPTATA